MAFFQLSLYCLTALGFICGDFCTASRFWLIGLRTTSTSVESAGSIPCPPTASTTSPIRSPRSLYHCVAVRLISFEPGFCEDKVLALTYRLRATSNSFRSEEHTSEL